MRIVTRFTGKNREFRAWLRQQTPKNVVYLSQCKLCGGLAAGAICRKCEPLFLKWTKKIALEIKANENPNTPSIA